MGFVEGYTLGLFMIYFLLVVLTAKEETLIKEVWQVFVNFLIYLPLVGRVFNWW